MTNDLSWQERAQAEYYRELGPGEGDGSFSIGSEIWPGASKLIEEMGELLQVLGKLMGTHGLVEHWDGSNLRDRLNEEVADVEAALRFFVQMNALDRPAIAVRTVDKFRLFAKWHNEAAAPADCETGQ